MFEEKSFEEVVLSGTSDMFDYLKIMESHNEELEKKSEELAIEKADSHFNAKKEAYRLEVIMEIEAANSAKKVAEISRSSVYVSESIIVDGKELQGSDFVLDSLGREPLYSECQLIHSENRCEYQLLYKNGKRKFVSDFVVVACAIVNATGQGKCKAVVVFLRGLETPLIFRKGDMSSSAIRRQTRFERKGLSVSSEVYCASFIEAVRKCTNIFFLTIPDHIGMNLLLSGAYDYASSLSVIPGLEELYSDEIKEHNLVKHERSFKEVIDDYKAKLPGFWRVKLAVVIRVMSILLPYFEEEKLRSDQIFVFTPRNEHEKKCFIALTKRYNYSSTVTTSLSERITKIRTALQTGNDITTIFSYLGGIDNLRSFKNGLTEIQLDVTGENGNEDNTRKIVILITDVPGTIPEEYPAYYLSFEEEIEKIDISDLQRLSGEVDYSLIQFLVNNPDSAKTLIHDSVALSKFFMTNCDAHKQSDTMAILIATASLLEKIGIVSSGELQAILNWFGNEATSRLNIRDTMCHKFKEAVSEAILNGELKIGKQNGPPYYSKDGCTAFIREEDKSINIDDDVIKNLIIPKLPIRSISKMNKYLNEKGALIGMHTNKRKLTVDFDEIVRDETEVFSYRRSILDASAKAYIDGILENEFWFDISEYPAGFVPVLLNVDGTKAAGYVVTPDMDENLHEVYFGATRSGKTFALVNRALVKMKFEGEDAVIIFDQTGGFSTAEIDKHIGKEMREKYFAFWNVYGDGVPIDLLDLRGCLTNKEEKERLTRIYALMSRTLGSYQEQILKVAVNCMVRQMKRCPDMKVSDILEYIEGISCNEKGELVMNEAHKKLYMKLKSVIEDLEDMPIHKNDWGELIKEQGKPIIVISTGADGVGKGSEIIDMMLESLYNYKQCHPDSRYTVVIDEAQDLYLHEKGAVNTLLCKGGKHGISMLLASQSFPDSTIAFGTVVGNCGRARGYRSKGNDLSRYADRFGCDKHEADSLQKGNCYDDGLFWSRYHKKNIIKTIKGKTVPFEPAPKMNNNNDDEAEQP